MRLMAIALAAAGAVSLLSAAIPARADEVITKRVIIHHPHHYYAYHHHWHPYHHGSTTIVTETVHH